MSLAGILNRLLTQRQNAVLSLLPACTKFKYYSNKPPEPIIIEGVPVSAVAQKKTKRPVVPRITLITGKDDVSVMTLEEAQKMSARRNLKLVKVLDFDTKSQRPVYKLMTAAEYTAEDIKQRKMKKSSSAYKGEKVLMLSSVIANHDLETQIKKIEKWVAKEYEVHVTISGNANNPEKNEDLYKKIEEQLKDSARLLQKRSKGSDLRFQIVPPKKEKAKETSDSSKTNDL